MQHTINNPKTIRAWTMYDWANSVYSLVIISTIFPIYYAANTSDFVDFLGWNVSNTVIYSYAISFSFLLVAILSPILSGIADYAGNKKSYMKFFVYLGSLSCMGLYFFKDGNVGYGLLCSTLASIGFAGSIVFYNSYLPEIATPDRHDKVSARGFSMGYIGSVILLIFALTMVMMPQLFFDVDGKWKEILAQNPGMDSDTALTEAKDSFAGSASRISFLLVGLWWIGFSQITFRRMPVIPKNRIKDGSILTKGFRELGKVWDQLKHMPQLKTYLVAFFFYNMGVQTVMYLAAQFGDKQLSIPAGLLIGAILIIQLVAIGGAFLFAFLSRQRGNIFSISIMLLIWLGVCVTVLFLYKTEETGLFGLKKHELLFLAVAFVVGMVMGGIQSLSRSTYAKLLPPTEDTTSFFSFYDVAEKMSTVGGTFMFGLAEAMTGSMRNSVLPLMAFFLIGIIILQFVRSPKLKAA